MRTRARNVFFVLLGVGGLVLKGRYAGPYQDVVRSYGGNVAASFAVYFVVTHLFVRSRWQRLWTVCLGLAVVELFELLNGFGVMANTYDRFDLVANAAGVAVALAVDSATGDGAPHASDQN
jgi:hypothetical protein